MGSKKSQKNRFSNFQTRFSGISEGQIEKQRIRKCSADKITSGSVVFMSTECLVSSGKFAENGPFSGKIAFLGVSGV